MKRKGSADVGEVLGVIVIIALLLLAVVLLVGHGCETGHDNGVEQTQREAIEAGAGEWRIDAKTGEKSFHWIGNKQEK